MQDDTEMEITEEIIAIRELLLALNRVQEFISGPLPENVVSVLENRGPHVLYNLKMAKYWLLRTEGVQDVATDVTL